MKKIIAISGIIFLLLFIGCEKQITPAKPNVTATPINDGGALRLTWTQVADADGYKIYRDGSLDTTLSKTTTSYDATKVCKRLKVTAYAGDNESDPWEFDLTPVVTTLTVYGMSDPDPNHQSGFGFMSDGSAVKYSVTNQPANIDFYFDDVNFSTMYIRGASDPGGPVQNANKENAISTQYGTNFDSLSVALGTGNYQMRRQISVGAVYALWIDMPTFDAMDANDHFAKIKIINVSGANNNIVDIKVAYQKVAGLRWLLTP